MSENDHGAGLAAVVNDTGSNKTVTARVRLSGCDDSTDFDVEVTPEQLEFLKAISRQSYDTSEYGCMPVLMINGERLERKAKDE